MSIKGLSPWDLGGQRITNVGSASADSDVVTRSYVNSTSMGRYRGGWRSDNTPTDGLGGYITYDIVTYNGTTYRANSSPTAGLAPVNDANWDVIAAAGINGANGTNGVSFTYQGDWVSGTPYTIGQWVAYNGSLYYCNGNISNLTALPNSGDPGWELGMEGNTSTLAAGKAITSTMRANGYLFGQANGAANASGISLNSASASPCFVSKATTVDRITLYITTGGSAGAVIRLGIYADNGSMWPGALVVDAGTIPTTSSGSTQELTISTSLSTAGVYWLVAKQEVATCTPRGCTGPVSGVVAIAGGTSDLVAGYYAALGSGGLPSSWPTWGTAGSGPVNNPARVGIRVTG